MPKKGQSERRRYVGRFAAAVLVVAALSGPRPAAAEDEGTGGAAHAQDHPVQLEPIDVQGQSPFPGDASFARLRRELGCDDCIQSQLRLPLAVAVTAAVASGLAQGIFPQPRVRGEPNDEALLMALRECWPDDYKCFSRYPSTAIYNWAPDENQGLLDDPNAYAR